MKLVSRPGSMADAYRDSVLCSLTSATEREALYVGFNNSGGGESVQLPPPPPSTCWHCLVDTGVWSYPVAAPLQPLHLHLLPAVLR